MSDAAVAQVCHPGFTDLAIAALAQHARLLPLPCILKLFALTIRLQRLSDGHKQLSF
jgi:hypothetical protein